MAGAAASLITMKLIQKHLIKGTQEFELRGEEVLVRIRGPFKKNKEKSVPLAILNPEPEIKDGLLNFHSRVKCGPLLSLYLNKPNTAEFNAFVDALKDKALQEFNTFSGIE